MDTFPSREAAEKMVAEITSYADSSGWSIDAAVDTPPEPGIYWVALKIPEFDQEVILRNENQWPGLRRKLTAGSVIPYRIHRCWRYVQDNDRLIQIPTVRVWGADGWTEYSMDPRVKDGRNIKVAFKAYPNERTSHYWSENWCRQGSVIQGIVEKMLSDQQAEIEGRYKKLE